MRAYPSSHRVEIRIPQFITGSHEETHTQKKLHCTIWFLFIQCIHFNHHTSYGMVVPLGAVLSREIISELYHSNVSVVLSSSSSCSFYTHTLAVLCNTAPMFSVLVAFHDLAKKKKNTCGKWEYTTNKPRTGSFYTERLEIEPAIFLAVRQTCDPPVPLCCPRLEITALWVPASCPMTPIQTRWG